MRPADWFGLCDTEREGYGCRPSIKLSGELVAPGWRNWQTQRTQNPPRATSWGFDPPSRLQDNKWLMWKTATPSEWPFLFGGCFGGCWFSTFRTIRFCGGCRGDAVNH